MCRLTLLLIFCFVYCFAQGQNIALGKNVVVSSVEGFNHTVYNGYKAVDGLGNSNVNTTTGTCTGNCTRWSSLPADGQYIYIDLAAQYYLTEVRLYWETADAKDFTIDVSNDLITWTTVHTMNNNSSFYNSFDMTGQTGRYVRMYGVDRNTGYGFSLWEFEVYGSPVVPLSPNLALNAPAVASSTAAGSPGNITDGFGGDGQVDYNGGCTGTCTYWTSGTGDAQNIYVDLGSTMSLAQAKIFWQGSMSANSFTIDLSNDAATWQPAAAEVTGNFGHANTVNLQGSSGRYVRLNLSTSNTSGAGYSVYEFQVFGQASTLPVHFTSFTGKVLNGGVNLEWSASFDKPTLFEIEKSLDGVHFSKVGSAYASTPLSATNRFSFRDGSPARGNNFYRIRYTEEGSAPIYSKVVAADMKGIVEMQVYPNPVKGSRFSLNLGTPYSSTVDIAIYNSLGKLVHQQKVTGSRQQLIPVNLNSKLSAGVYTIQAQAGSVVQKGRLVIAQ